MEIRDYKSYPQALDELAKTLRGRAFDPNEYYIVITPDRYTQGVEKALFGGTGALDCEVLTLSRLGRRIVERSAGLSREGGVMLIAQAVANVKDSLTYYKRAARYTDFARSVYDALMQIKSSDAELSALKASGVTKSKLNDLALIKSEYEKIKCDGKDASDRLDELARAVPNSELIKNSHVYAIGFSQSGADTTRLNKRVFAEIAKHAKSFLYMQAKPPLSPREQMRIFGAPDRVSEYKRVAAEVRKYIHGGGRYGDISIICPEPRALRRILKEYDIPFYSDEAAPLADTPPLIALSYIYKLKTSAESDTLVSLCKNPYSGCAESDAQMLQLYISDNGLYNALDAEIADPSAARAVERVKKLISLLGDSFADGVRDIVENGEFAKIQTETDPNGTDAVTPILNLVELLKSYGTNAFDTDAASFFSAASAVDIKSVPRERDRVNVTMPQTLRLTACKMLFVTDFNEGDLPTVTADTGLLADNELDEINASGGGVEPTALEQNRRNRAELAAVVYNAQNVFCSYTTAGNARPAAFMETLAKKAVREDHAELCAALKATDNAELIADYACVDGAVRELAARKAVKHTASLNAAASVSENISAPVEQTVGSMTKSTLSVSELTHWFKCPYKRFLTDEIGLKERKTAELAAPDFGILVHEFMQIFIKESDGVYDCSIENVSRIIDRVLSEKNIKLEPEVQARIASDAADYARINAKIIEAGDYKPTEFEKGFGGKLTLGKNNVRFVGFIDRVDVCGGKARIIDYKTGRKKFDINECLNGNDMQLPLYAAAVDMPVTGMFYVRLSPRYDSKERDMSGCMVKDLSLAVEYDHALEEGCTSEIVPVRTKLNKDNELEFSGSNSGGLLEKAEFDALKTSCVQTASQAADEIQTGYIARTPAAGACEYCAFRGICGRTARPRGENNEGDDE